MHARVSRGERGLIFGLSVNRTNLIVMIKGSEELDEQYRLAVKTRTGARNMKLK